MNLGNLNVAFKQSAWPLKPDSGEYSQQVKLVLALFYAAEDQNYLKAFSFAYTAIHRKSPDQYAMFRVGHQSDSTLVPLSETDLQAMQEGIEQLQDKTQYTLSDDGKLFTARLKAEIKRAERSLQAHASYVEAQAHKPMALGYRA